MSDVLERFLRYVRFDTRSDETSTTSPSTATQLVFQHRLADELKALGLQDAVVDEHGYVMATVPATTAKTSVPAIGFIAHVDTSPEMSGDNVVPLVHERYDGRAIVLPDDSTAVLSLSDSPGLSQQLGNDIVTASGTTLLGADDKAGVAEIVTAAAYLMARPEIPHGVVRLAFTPDEEIGRGASHFDVQRFGCRCAYTLDGGSRGEVESESFCADAMTVTFHGFNTHPGYAKGRMVNAIKVAHKFRLDGTEDAALFAAAPDGAEPKRWEADEDATCSVNYTSGTTARPKGVQLTQRNCWLNAAAFGWHTGVSDRDVLLHTLPMFHCNGWGMPYAVTGMGGTHIALRKVDGEEILTRIERHGVTLLCGAPAVVAAILGAAEERAAAGRAVPGRGTVRMVVAGAPPPSKTIERIETELGWEFIQIYGLTETAPLLTINRAPAEWDALDPAGRSQLLSRAGTPAIGVRIEVDTDGEVLAQSNHVFAGYWEQPDETGKALEGGWFHTGDGGYLDGPYTVIADRKKDVIITGGENVSSIEVEDCLYQHPAVGEVAAIGVPDEKWGETIKALVVLRAGETASEADLIAHCRDRLAHFKAPTSVEFRDALDRTATGKLQKYKLRQPYWAGLEKAVN